MCENKIVNAAASVPKDAARSYIIDMLGELCVVADQSGHGEILALLKLTRQAVVEQNP